jgi:hypothetical protein
MKPRAFYLVVCDHADGPIIYETMVADMDFATVARHFSEGQFRQPSRVIEFVPQAGTCRDVSHEFFLNPDADPQS